MRIHGVLLQIFRQSSKFRSGNCGQLVSRQGSVLSSVLSNHYSQLLGDWGHWGRRSHCSCLNWSSRPFTTHPALKADAEMVDITFITPDGTRHKTKGKVGDNLLDVVVNNNVDLDGFGACEGTLACSTCHLVFKQEDFDKIKDEVTDEELDMLDLAYGLTDTSRLGCQVTLTKELGGLEVEVPAGVNDARS